VDASRNGRPSSDRFDAMKNKTWCLLGLTLIAAVIVTADQNPPIVPSDEGMPRGAGKKCDGGGLSTSTRSSDGARPSS
jgi:hypothetical protein